MLRLCRPVWLRSHGLLLIRLLLLLRQLLRRRMLQLRVLLLRISRMLLVLRLQRSRSGCEWLRRCSERW
jgi:hypothetical protein